MPPGGAPPTADPGPPPINPDVIGLLQDTISKVEQVGSGMASLDQRLAAIESDKKHKAEMNSQRQQLISTFTDT